MWTQRSRAAEGGRPVRMEAELEGGIQEQRKAKDYGPPPGAGGGKEGSFPRAFRENGSWQYLDFRLPASKVMTNKFCVKPPSLG